MNIQFRTPTRCPSFLVRGKASCVPSAPPCERRLGVQGLGVHRSAPTGLDKDIEPVVGEVSREIRAGTFTLRVGLGRWAWNRAGLLGCQECHSTGSAPGPRSPALSNMEQHENRNQAHEGHPPRSPPGLQLPFRLSTLSWLPRQSAPLISVLGSFLFGFRKGAGILQKGRNANGRSVQLE